MKKILMKAFDADRQNSRFWFSEAAKRAKRKFGTDEVYDERPEWFNLTMLNDRTAEIKIYGALTEFPWVDDEVSASQVYNDLSGLDADTVHVRINSPGGSVFEGLAIYSLLQEQSAKVIAHIDGIAASAATFVALGADEIHMNPGGQFMIHKPYTLEVGNSDEMRKTADTLDRIEAGMVALYQRKTKATKGEIRSMVADETWLTAEEALELGFVDEIKEGQVLEDEQPTAQATDTISEPVAAQKDFQPVEEAERKKPAHGERARRLALLERQLETT